MKKFMKNMRKSISMIMVIIMILAMTMVPAFALDNDPNMTAYNGQFTVVVDKASIGILGKKVDIFAVPADASFTPTTFTTSTAAQNVVWTLVGGSTSGITKGTSTSHALTGGGYASKLTVNISYLTQPGPASFLATNPLTGGYVNITVVVNNNANNDNVNTASPIVSYRVYEPGNPTPKTGIALTSLDAALHTDDRSYVTVFDSVQNMKNIGVISNFTETWGFVNSMTVNGATYMNAGMNGWQYRAYRFSGGSYNIVGISEILGIGDMDADAIDLIVWKYGAFDDNTLFPNTIP